MSKTYPIGIDLGSSHCRVGVFRNGKFEIIPNENGGRDFAPFVGFTDKQRLIGDAAKSQIEANPANTVYDVKRLIGLKFDELPTDLNCYPFKVINDGLKPKIEVKYKGETQTFSPEEILSFMLRKMKRDAELYLKRSITHAVIAVPVNFSYLQRQAVKDCAAIANLNVLRIVNDSTISIFAYDFEKKISNPNFLESDRETNVFIFDLGSCYCNVSIVEISSHYNVISAAGEKNVGGSSFDTCLVNYFVAEFKKKHQKDLSTDQKALARLRTACQRAKRTLSTESEAKIKIASLYDGIDFNFNITRTKFEEICEQLFSDISKIVERCIKGFRFRTYKIVLIGNSSRIPKIELLLKQLLFKYQKVEASFRAGALNEAIAYGAAGQAALLFGNRYFSELLLVEATSHLLGFKVGDNTTIAIKRNTAISVKQIIPISTFLDNQSEMQISVFECYENRYIILGNIEIKEIQPAPKGVPIIEVTFNIDADYNLQVSAIEKYTNKKFKMIPNDENRLSKEEIEQMKLRADFLDKENQLESDKITERNRLETFALQVKYIIENRTKKTIEKVNETKQWIESNYNASSDEFIQKRQQLENESIRDLMDIVEAIHDL